MMTCSYCCFICGKLLLLEPATSTTVERQEEEEEEEGGRGRWRWSSDMRSLLSLLCKLMVVADWKVKSSHHRRPRGGLGTGGTTTTGDGGEGEEEGEEEEEDDDDDDDWNSQTCGNCFNVLVQMEQLHALVERTKTSLAHHVKQVESLVLKSSSSSLSGTGNVSCQAWTAPFRNFREQVIQAASQRLQPVHQTPPPPPPSSTSIKVERMSPVPEECDDDDDHSPPGDEEVVRAGPDSDNDNFLNSPIIDEEDDCCSLPKTDFEFAPSSPTSNPQKKSRRSAVVVETRRRRSPRKHAVTPCSVRLEKVDEVIGGAGGMKRRSSSGGGGGFNKKNKNSIKKLKLDKSEFFDQFDDDSDYDEPSEEAGRSSESKSASKRLYRRNSDIRGPFLLASDNLYLFLNCIFVSKSESHLLCRSFQCTFQAEWEPYTAFQTMRKHILRNHWSTKHLEDHPHPCYLCDQRLFPSEHSFRSHLPLRHEPIAPKNRKALAVCEVCLRPTLKEKIRDHMFTHKNEEEVASAINANKVPSMTRIHMKKKRLSAHMMTHDGGGGDVDVGVEHVSPPPAAKPKTRRRRRRGKPKKSSVIDDYDFDDPGGRGTKVKIVVDSGSESEYAPSANENEEEEDDDNDSGAGSEYEKEEEGPPKACFGRRGKKPQGARKRSKGYRVKLEEEVEEDEAPEGSDCAPSDVDSGSDCEEEEEKPGSSKSSLPKGSNNSRPKVVQFIPYVIADASKDQYLFRQATFVSKTPTHLVCHAFQCNFRVRLTFHQPAFQKMRRHLLTFHRDRKHRAKTHPCLLCNKQFPSQLAFRSHLPGLHDHLVSANWVGICECCFKPIPCFTGNYGSLRTHMFSHKSQPEKEVALASGDVIARSRRPKASEISEAKYKCSWEGCSFATKHQKSITRHEQSHLPPEQRSDRTTCDQCGASVVAEYLKRHIIRVHNPELAESILKCVYCDKKYFSNQNALFQAHLLTHRGVIPFMCEECGASYTTYAGLYSHTREKHGPPSETPLKCDHCDKSYTRLASLKKHERDHHSELLPPRLKRNRVTKLNRLGTAEEEDDDDGGSGGKKKPVYGPVQHWPCSLCDKICTQKCALQRHQHRKHGVPYPKKREAGFVRSNDAVNNGTEGELT